MRDESLFREVISKLPTPSREIQATYNQTTRSNNTRHLAIQDQDEKVILLVNATQHLMKNHDSYGGTHNFWILLGKAFQIGGLDSCKGSRDKFNEMMNKIRGGYIFATQSFFFFFYFARFRCELLDNF